MGDGKSSYGAGEMTAVYPSSAKKPQSSAELLPHVQANR
jgi:hypothetical protein